MDAYAFGAPAQQLADALRAEPAPACSSGR